MYRYGKLYMFFPHRIPWGRPIKLGQGPLFCSIANKSVNNLLQYNSIYNIVYNNNIKLDIIGKEFNSNFTIEQLRQVVYKHQK